MTHEHERVDFIGESATYAARDQVLLFSTAQHTTVVHIADENVTAKVLPQQKHNTTIHNKNLKTNIQIYK